MRLKFFPVNKAKNKLLHGIGKTLKKWASKYSHNLILQVMPNVNENIYGKIKYQVKLTAGNY